MIKFNKTWVKPTNCVSRNQFVELNMSLDGPKGVLKGKKRKKEQNKEFIKVVTQKF